MKAAKRFDETKGFKFISYAVWWIRQSILQAIVEYSRIVRLPLNKVGAYNKIQEAVTSFVQEFERPPSSEELSELLDKTPKEIEQLMQSSTRHVSFDAPVKSDDESSATMLDLMHFDDDNMPDLKLMKQSLKDEVNIGMSVLAPREYEILCAYYGLNGKPSLTLEVIGEMYDLTRERVRQIKERALRRLRKSFKNGSLRYHRG